MSVFQALVRRYHLPLTHCVRRWAGGDAGAHRRSLKDTGVRPTVSIPLTFGLAAPSDDGDPSHRPGELPIARAPTLNATQVVSKARIFDDSSWTDANLSRIEHSVSLDRVITMRSEVGIPQTARLSKSPTRPGGRSRPRLVVVSYLANSPFSPRGIRTQALLNALRRDWSVEIVAGPEEMRHSQSEEIVPSSMRKSLNYVHSSIMLDKFEVWSRRRFHAWRPNAVGALLIGFPFSPLVYAARRLQAEGMPYVVDIGDPWVLTIAGGRPATRNFGRMRARSAERRLWSRAAGAVVTTESQASALRRFFPQLQVLVRPNGFAPEDAARTAAHEPDRSSASNTRLRLVHFGDIFAARLRIESFLSSLALSGRWDEIEFHQYGRDWTGVLKVQTDVQAVFHDRRPWSEIIELAEQYDLAVVVGNLDPTTLPSKAISYLQLPIPRLAVVQDDRNDALADYVSGKPGWMVLRAEGSDAPEAIARHTSRNWTSAELAPPATEAWDNVSREVSQFVLGALRGNVTPGRAASESE